MEYCCTYFSLLQFVIESPMYYCNTSSWCVHVGPHVGGSSVKTMQEMIPVAYKTLRQEIERLQEDVWSKQVPPVMNRDAFWYIWKYGYVHTHNMQHNTYHFKPSARMHSEGYGTWFVSGVCLSVCLSVTTFFLRLRSTLHKHDTNGFIATLALLF